MSVQVAGHNAGRLTKEEHKQRQVSGVSMHYIRCYGHRSVKMKEDAVLVLLYILLFNYGKEMTCVALADPQQPKKKIIPGHAGRALKKLYEIHAHFTCYPQNFAYYAEGVLVGSMTLPGAGIVRLFYWRRSQPQFLLDHHVPAISGVFGGISDAPGACRAITCRSYQLTGLYTDNSRLIFAAPTRWLTENTISKTW